MGLIGSKSGLGMMAFWHSSGYSSVNRQYIILRCFNGGSKKDFQAKELEWYKIKEICYFCFILISFIKYFFFLQNNRNFNITNNIFLVFIRISEK